MATHKPKYNILIKNDIKSKKYIFVYISKINGLFAKRDKVTK